ncbi:MAG: sulfotransferase [Solirubrobacterales bacterium]|nr:sulfotransferase [Solirubrobacterales bacterium]
MPTGLDTEAVPARTASPDLRDPCPLLFIGGTGRSGTHVVSKILGAHSRFRKVPNEARFHVDPGGFPDVLAGRTGPDLFAYRLRHYWWRNFEPARLSFRGLHRYVPRRRLDAATEAFLRRCERGEPEAACRQLFFDLLWPLAAEEAKAGLIEQSCDVVAEAGTLGDLFPEARFVHVVRDGRDVAASRVGQARWLAYPRTMGQGLAWWESRIRRIDAGIRAVGSDRVHEVSLDDLVSGNRRKHTYRKLRQFAGLRNEDAMLGYFRRRVKVRNAHAERWRQDVPAREHDSVDARYEQILDALEADGISCVRLLRRVRARRAG